MPIYLTGKSRSLRSSAGAGEVAFTPTDIAGLKVWLKADALVLANDDPVATWTDSSGLGNNFTTAGGNRPTYKTNIKNGLPVVRFDGTDDQIDCGASMTLRHVFVVVYINYATFPAGAPGFKGVISGMAGADQLILTGSESTTLFANDVITTVYHLDGISHAEAAMEAPMQAWGVCSVSAAAGWTLTPRLGIDRNNTNRWLNGDIGEVIIYDSVLSTEDRQVVEAYLKDKWDTV